MRKAITALVGVCLLTIVSCGGGGGGDGTTSLNQSSGIVLTENNESRLAGYSNSLNVEFLSSVNSDGTIAITIKLIERNKLFTASIGADGEYINAQVTLIKGSDKATLDVEDKNSLESLLVEMKLLLDSTSRTSLFSQRTLSNRSGFGLWDYTKYFASASFDWASNMTEATIAGGSSLILSYGTSYPIIGPAIKEAVSSWANVVSLCGQTGKEVRGWWRDEYDKVHSVNVVIGPDSDDCMGRCGSGCMGLIHRYTQNCLNHDLCTRYEGSILGECQDEFDVASYDFYNADICYEDNVTVPDDGAIPTGSDTTTQNSPSGLSATAQNGSVLLSWNAVSGAQSYNIYFRNRQGVTTFNGQKLGASGTSYTHTGLTNNTPYYYIVTSVTDGEESAPSSEVSATPKGIVDGAPTAPSITAAPPSATQNQSVSVTVRRGTDPDGDRVKVQCTASGSQYASNAWKSGLRSGGMANTFAITFTATGNQTIWCTSFDEGGKASGVASRSITINPPGGGGGGGNRPPTLPSITAPSSATQNQSVSVTVRRGTDPDGDLVKLECTASGSRYASNAWKSGLRSGGMAETFSITFTSTGNKTIWCTSFDENGNASNGSSHPITITSSGGGGGGGGNNPPTSPSINAPGSATQNTTVSVGVTSGTDPDGDQVKVQCTASGSQYSSSPWVSSWWGSGGGSATFYPRFSSTGNKTIWCTTFDATGRASGTRTKGITINSSGGGGGGTNPPTSPSISAPPSATQNQSVSVTVTSGTDPDGDQVKVQCTASGSQYSSSPWVSSWWGSGGGSATFYPRFSSTGNKTIWCTTFDATGRASGTRTKGITINSSGGGGGGGGNNPPSSPSISAPPSATQNTTVSVGVTSGTDPDGDRVKVQCTASGSQYSSSPWVSSWWGSGGGSATFYPRFSSTGNKTIWCTTFDATGRASGTRTKGITINGTPPSASPSSTSSGGGTWGAILRMSAGISGTTATFSVTKTSGTFSSSGTLYLREGSPTGTTRTIRSISAGQSGASMSINLGSYSGYPKSYYGVYGTAAGWAYVGPITINWSGH